LIQSFNEISQGGQIAPDNNIGRFIADAVASLPKLPPQVFDNLVNDSLQVKDCKFQAKAKHFVKN